jgi:hypothetical protein
LGMTLCPELGSKGSIPHSELEVSNLQGHSEDLINYLRQDILLLGGVMLKAQEIIWEKYHIDIVKVMTLSSLSLTFVRIILMMRPFIFIYLQGTKTALLGVAIMEVMLMSISPMVRIFTIMM